jgi:hypothetical protein
MIFLVWFGLSVLGALLHLSIQRKTMVVRATQGCRRGSGLRQNPVHPLGLIASCCRSAPAG